MEKRWVVRRSEPVKEVLLIEDKVYPGKAQVTIGLRIQKRFNLEKYGCTRTRPENWNQRLRQPYSWRQKTHLFGNPANHNKRLAITPKHRSGPAGAGTRYDWSMSLWCIAYSASSRRSETPSLSKMLCK